MSHPSDNPVFLVGAERSGTTLLRLMLAYHPRLSVLSEFEYITDPLEPGFGGDGSIPSGDRLREFLATQWMFHQHRKDEGLSPSDDSDYRAVARDLLRQAADLKPEADTLIAIVHRGMKHLPTLFGDRPTRYIHIVRDPRDVARSNIGMGWAGNVYHGVERWLDVERQWEALRPTLAEGTYMELRQEDLILDTEPTLRRICAFLGLDYDPAMMDYQRESTYEKPDPSLVEQWKRKQTPEQIGLVEARVGDLLAARGYEPSGHPPVSPGTLGRARLKLDDKLSRLRWRGRVNGWGLLTQDILSRKLGMKRWQAKLQPRLLERFETTLR